MRQKASKNPLKDGPALPTDLAIKLSIEVCGNVELLVTRH